MAEAADTRATRAVRTVATGVTGSAAKTSGRSNGPTGDWRSGITGLPEALLRTTCVADDKTATSTRPPYTAAPPAAPLGSLGQHTPLVPLLRLPHTHPPQRQLQQWEAEEEEEEQGRLHTPATP
ncbi:unnamed protein product [Closterium sp. NIES-54]